MLAIHEELAQVFRSNTSDDLSPDFDPVRIIMPSIGASFLMKRGDYDDVFDTLESCCMPFDKRGNDGGWLKLDQLPTIPANYFYSSSCSHKGKCCTVDKSGERVPGAICPYQWWQFEDNGTDQGPRFQHPPKQ